MKANGKLKVLVRSAVFLAGLFAITFSCSMAFAKQPVTIKFESWWLTEAGHDKWLNAFLDKFEKENPGIKLDRIAIASSAVHDKFMTEAAAGTGPDVLWFRDISLVPFAKMGFLEPLDKYIKPSQYKLESINNEGVIDGHRYALNLMSFAYGQLIYNKKMLADAGLKPPTTPEELIDVAKKLTKAPDQYGFGMPVVPTETEYFAQGIQKFASGFDAGISKNGKIAVNDPNFVKGVECFKKVYDADVTPKGIGWSVQRRMFADNKIAMIFDGAYQFGIIDGFYPGHSNDFGAVRPPFPGNHVLFNENFFGISKASKHKAEAVKFLKWWIRADNQAEYNMFGLHIGTVKTNYPKAWLDQHPYLAAYNDPKLIPMPTMVKGFEEQSEQIRRTLVDNVAQIFFANKPIDQAMNDAEKVLGDIVKK